MRERERESDTWTVHSESVAAVRKDLATKLVELFFGEASLLTRFFHKFQGDFVQEVQSLFPV